MEFATVSCFLCVCSICLCHFAAGSFIQWGHFYYIHPGKDSVHQDATLTFGTSTLRSRCAVWWLPTWVIGGGFTGVTLSLRRVSRMVIWCTEGGQLGGDKRRRSLTGNRQTQRLHWNSWRGSLLYCCKALCNSYPVKTTTTTTANNLDERCLNPGWGWAQREPGTPTFISRLKTQNSRAAQDCDTPTHRPIPLHFALISWERSNKSSKINSNQVDLPLMAFMAAQHCWDISRGGTWSHVKCFMTAVWHDTWQDVCCCKNVMCTSIKEDIESTVWMMFYYKPNRSLDQNQSRCWLTAASRFMFVQFKLTWISETCKVSSGWQADESVTGQKA